VNLFAKHFHIQIIYNKLLSGCSQKRIGLYVMSVIVVCFQRLLKGKGKAIPLQAKTGPEVSRRLRLPVFKTISI